MSRQRGTKNYELSLNLSKKVILKYKRNHYYAIEKTKYIWFKDIITMIKNKEDFIILEQQTKEDITNSTLLSIYMKQIWKKYQKSKKEALLMDNIDILKEKIILECV